MLITQIQKRWNKKNQISLVFIKYSQKVSGGAMRLLEKK